MRYGTAELSVPDIGVIHLIRRLHSSDGRYDRGAYLKDTQHFESTYYCLLKSFSQTRSANWSWRDKKIKTPDLTDRMWLLAANFASLPALTQGFLRFSVWISRSLDSWPITWVFWFFRTLRSLRMVS